MFYCQRSHLRKYSLDRPGNGTEFGISHQEKIGTISSTMNNLKFYVSEAEPSRLLRKRFLSSWSFPQASFAVVTCRLVITIRFLAGHNLEFYGSEAELFYLCHYYSKSYLDIRLIHGKSVYLWLTSAKGA
jgi:hypothetical protein